MKQQIKDLVLLLQRLWSLLWRGFGPGLGNYHTLWGGPKEKKKIPGKWGNIKFVAF